MDANSIRFWSARACSSAVELRTFNPGVVGSNPTGPSRVSMEGPVGFEPTTPGLKVRSSTAELRAPADRNLYLFSRGNKLTEGLLLNHIIALPTNCRHKFRNRCAGWHQAHSRRRAACPA